MEIKVSFSLIRICIAIWLFIATWIDLSQYKRCLQMSPRINNCRWSIEKTKILDTDPEITYQLSLIKPNDFLKLFFAPPIQSNTKKKYECYMVICLHRSASWTSISQSFSKLF